MLMNNQVQREIQARLGDFVWGLSGNPFSSVSPKGKMLSGLVKLLVEGVLMLKV
jgi:hypothetical protein